MIKLLFGLNIFFGLILFLTGALGVKILRTLFGFGRKQKPTKNNQTHTYTDIRNRDKVFGDDVGEYVEFEEVDENNDNDDKQEED
ncbi:MAG: DUF4834 family protein [Porphyromonadaceae bacterium]|nr:DUF4834 family protein [Porphyromonadaceae bacterium]